MRLRRNLRRGRERGQCAWIRIAEGIGGVSQAIRIDSVWALSTDCGAELLGESREARIVGDVTVGVVEYRRTQRGKLQIAQNRAHVAERFMESGRFLTAGVKKLR